MEFNYSGTGMNCKNRENSEVPGVISAQLLDTVYKLFPEEIISQRIST
jgi:hypothetical protein